MSRQDSRISGSPSNGLAKKKGHLWYEKKFDKAPKLNVNKTPSGIPSSSSLAFIRSAVDGVFVFISSFVSLFGWVVDREGLKTTHSMIMR